MRLVGMFPEWKGMSKSDLRDFGPLSGVIGVALGEWNEAFWVQLGMIRCEVVGICA